MLLKNLKLILVKLKVEVHIFKTKHQKFKKITSILTFCTKIAIYTYENSGVEVEKVDKVERVEVEDGKVYPSPGRAK